MGSQHAVIAAALHLAELLPGPTVQAVARAIRKVPTSQLDSELQACVPQLQHRDHARRFVAVWQQQAAELSVDVVAMCLQTAAAAEQRQRDSRSAELVWTGPEPQGAVFRRTEQAILQLLDTAKQRITIVSYAVYSIPNIAAALIRAAKRGVQLTVIVETPDKLDGQQAYSTLRALGAAVEACSRVYYWPKENRVLSESGKPGLLHVKCAVADGEWLFLSSANLTQQAFTINMELGMLVRGGTMAGRVEQQFAGLIADGTLLPVSGG